MTDNFIRMCDCPEIQGGWEPRVGDWTDKGLVVGDVYINSHGEKSLNIDGLIYNQPLNNLIFKPSIEQLLGMVGCVDGSHKEIIERFVNAEYFFSIKEKWLAFVMHELHSLKWSGSVWEKIK